MNVSPSSSSNQHKPRRQRPQAPVFCALLFARVRLRGCTRERSPEARPQCGSAGMNGRIAEE